MKTIDDIADIVDNVQLDDFGHFLVKFYEGSNDRVIYIQHAYSRLDAVTGEMGWGYGRKWHVSPYATESEIVLTCLKAAITDAEHEVREGFRYKGYPIFQPHQSVDALVQACQQSDARKVSVSLDETQRALRLG